MDGWLVDFWPSEGVVGEVAGQWNEDLGITLIWRIEERCGLQGVEHGVGEGSVIASTTAPATLVKLWSSVLPASIKFQSFRGASVAAFNQS